MIFILAIVVLSTAIGGCAGGEGGSANPDNDLVLPESQSKRESRPAVVPTTKTAPTPSAAPPAATLPVNALSSMERDEAALRQTPVVGARLLSGRSLSLKLWLQGGGKAVFKPMRKGDNRARYEVAAHLLAEWLGVEGVPAAAMRSLRLEFLASRVAEEDKAAAQRLRNEVLVGPDGMVPGAMIAWVDDIDFKGLEALGGFKAMRKWLAPARPRGAGDDPLADDAARLVVFDFLIGNWDRLSGGNLFVSTGRRRLVLIDHNGTFADWPEKRKARMEKMLGEIERFPAAMVARIRALTAEDVSRVLAKDPWDARQPLLDAKEIALLFARRDHLLQHLDRLIAIKGGNDVLVFE